MPSIEFLLTELTCGDENRAEAASLQLIEYGETSVEALTNLFRSENADNRWWAIRALALFDHPLAKTTIANALRDENLEVQQCAALALRENPDPETIPFLTSLLGHNNKLLSRLSGDALIKIGKEATQAVMNVVENGSKAARIEAVRVLAGIEDPEAISHLFKLLDEESTFLRYWAEEGLNKMGVGMMFFKPE